MRPAPASTECSTLQHSEFLFQSGSCLSSHHSESLFRDWHFRERSVHRKGIAIADYGRSGTQRRKRPGVCRSLATSCFLACLDTSATTFVGASTPASCARLTAASATPQGAAIEPGCFDHLSVLRVASSQPAPVHGLFRRADETRKRVGLCSAHDLLNYRAGSAYPRNGCGHAKSGVRGGKQRVMGQAWGRCHRHTIDWRAYVW